MSHAEGKVRFGDGDIMYFEYDGTSDVAQPTLYKTHDELWEKWRNEDWNECKCGKDEPVEIAETYGGGTHWNGRACRKCMAITSPLSWDAFWDDSEDDLPDWYCE